jgi:Ino eighty subunit 2
MPSSKLREVTNSSGRTSSGRRNVNVFTDNPIVSGPRSSRTKKKLVEIDTSDEEDSDGEGADGLEDAPGEDDDDEEEAEDDDSLDADGDVDMDDISPQPPISKRANRLAAMAPPTKGKPIKGVEEKEMELAEDDDDEELSELDSDAEGEADETLLQDDEMGEGGEDEELDEEDEDDEEVEEDLEEDGTPATGSRASTPDYNKLTKRQRGSLGSDFLQLPMGKAFASSAHHTQLLTEPRTSSQEASNGRRARNAPC